MRTEIALHCPDCVVDEPPCPMPWSDARRFGLGHAISITDQAARGLHRTLPVWLGVATASVVVLRIAGRRLRPGTAASVALGAQTAWIVGFATVSGTRTSVRLSRLDGEQMLALRISCPAGGPEVMACAHHSAVRDSHYVDGVFAWPRGAGGGSLILRRLLALADERGWPLTLTALSPRTATAYRRAGFRPIVWIYWMRREAAPEGS